LLALVFLSNLFVPHAAPSARTTKASSSHDANTSHATTATAAQPDSTSSTSHPDSSSRAASAFARLPLRFEANRGQADARVRFLARGLGYGLFLTPSEAVLVLRRAARKASGDRGSVIRVKLVGANPDPSVEGVGELPGRSSYFIGRDPARWRAGAQAFAGVRYAQVYPGVDLVYYGNQQQLEYDYDLAPGADPRAIRVSFEGARARVAAGGDLVLRTRDGAEVHEQRPFAYQEVGGERRAVEARFVARGKNSFGFEVGAYDASKPLVIDPSLVYSTYVGGASPVNGNDQAFGIAVDSQGCAYITGETASYTFPTTPGAYRTTPDTGFSSSDAFVAKLDPTGSSLVYSTYLGGVDTQFGNSAGDTGYAIAVDSQGNAYVAGHTMSDTFPTTPGAAQPNPPAGLDHAFITKLNPTGTALVYSSYIGGQGSNYAFAVALDAAGRAYVTGSTSSTTFPVTPGAFQTAATPNEGHAFVVKLNPAGSAYDYATYLGGNTGEDGEGIAVDASGRAYVTGSTSSTNFPTTPGAFQSSYQSVGSFFFTQGDAFLTVLNAGGTGVDYSTYLGGSSQEQGLGVAVDASGAAYVVGSTLSSDFPTTPGALQTAYHFNTDAFLSKINPAASGAASLVYSTYLGGGGLDRAENVALDSQGNVYVAGGTNSNDFPVTSCAAQATASGGQTGLTKDAFLTKLNLSAPGAAALAYSTYLGGNDFESARDVAVDSHGSAYIAGATRSTDFPTTPGAFQTSLQQSPQPQDAFVAKLDPTACNNNDTTPPTISCPAPVNVTTDPGSCSAVVTYSASASDDRPGVTVSYDPPSGSVFPLGTTIVTATATDAAGNTASCRFDVTVRDAQPPVISCPADITVAGNIFGSCSASVAVGTPSASDSCSAVAVAGVRSDGQALDAPYPQGATTINWTATDASGNAASCQQHVTVNNPAPSVQIISPESGSVFATGTPVTFRGSYTDNAGGTHTATWSFDSVTQPGSVNEATGEVTATHTFTSPGLYPVSLTVDDGCGGTATATTVGEFDALVVVYDPNEGFVTGGGWINSPAGADYAAPGATGKANFGFNSKYLPGATTPSGDTEFQLKSGNLNFHSTSYDWLVVSGAKAQYRGTGTVNGGGNYGFTVTVIDGDQPGGDHVDRFRIKIWNKDTGALVYDTQPGAPSSADPTTPLGGGSIVIHQQ
jgi:hypothetical protein